MARVMNSRNKPVATIADAESFFAEHNNYPLFLEIKAGKVNRREFSSTIRAREWE
jgi:hypothetical protein